MIIHHRALSLGPALNVEIEILNSNHKTFETAFQGGKKTHHKLGPLGPLGPVGPSQRLVMLSLADRRDRCKAPVGKGASAGKMLRLCHCFAKSCQILCQQTRDAQCQAMRTFDIYMVRICPGLLLLYTFDNPALALLGLKEMGECSEMDLDSFFLPDDTP